MGGQRAGHPRHTYINVITCKDSELTELFSGYPFNAAESAHKIVKVIIHAAAGFGYYSIRIRQFDIRLHKPGPSVSNGRSEQALSLHDTFRAPSFIG